MAIVRGRCGRDGMVDIRDLKSLGPRPCGFESHRPHQFYDWISMKYDDKEISGIGDLLECLADQMPEDEPVWFRGHGDVEWNLDCTLSRVRTQ